MLTPMERKKVEQIKRDPAMREAFKGMSDEDILAKYRFVEDGQGIKVYDSVEAYRAAKRKRNIDTIEE